MVNVVRFRLGSPTRVDPGDLYDIDNHLIEHYDGFFQTCGRGGFKAAGKFIVEYAIEYTVNCFVSLSLFEKRLKPFLKQLQMKYAVKKVPFESTPTEFICSRL